MMVRPISLLCIGALALGLTACQKDAAPAQPAQKPAASKTPTSATKTPAAKTAAPFRAQFNDAQVVQFTPTQGKWMVSWQTPKKAAALDLATVCAKDLFFDGAVKPLAPLGMFHNPKLQRQELLFSVMSNSYETGRGEKRKAIVYVAKDGVLRCRHADNYAFKLQRKSCLKTACAPVSKGISR